MKKIALSSIIQKELKKIQIISSVRVSGGREVVFLFYFCGDNIIGSKDTDP